MSENVKKFTCNFCQKNYASPQSLCNHRRSIHKVYPQQEKDDIIPQIQQKKDDTIHYETDAKNNICDFCNKEYSSRQAKSRHLKICKARKDQELISIKNDLEQIKMQINNTNNGTINNVNIIALGNENIPALFNTDMKLQVLNKKNNALFHLIEKVHFNDEYPQFQNVYITNNRTNEAHLYDVKSKKFKVVDKDEVISDIIEYRVCDIEEFYEELGDKLDQRVKDVLEDLFRERGDDNVTRDKVKLLIFNNRV